MTKSTLPQVESLLSGFNKKNLTQASAKIPNKKWLFSDNETPNVSIFLNTYQMKKKISGIIKKYFEMYSIHSRT